MTITLFFPGLGLSFELNRVAFTVAGQPIYWYGIIIGLAFAGAALVTVKRAKLFGLDPDRMMDVFIVTAIGGVIGARLYYVAFRWELYAGDFMSIVNLRQGGLAIYGGVIAGILSCWLICRLRRVKFLPAIDLIASGLLLAQAIGRWGNFVNIEAFGRNTTAPWGMRSPVITDFLIANEARLTELGMVIDPFIPVHPTFLYESIWNIIGFVLITLYIKHRKFDGEILLIYLGWYGLGRAWIEPLRTDSLMMGGVRISQLIAILCVAASVITLLVIHSRIRQSPSYLTLYPNTDEAKAILAGTFYKKGGIDSGDSVVKSFAPRLHEWRRIKARNKWSASKRQMSEISRGKITLRRRKRL
ncbi:MAG: prolipoprotein diacylglyceryl transferase [Oscillospiraceae bacterium]|nr:prolipoprotein diacylglyceryl transferase [Oscillospiraceae bacterium]